MIDIILMDLFCVMSIFKYIIDDVGRIRLLSIGKSKSMTERQWFAEREREKGNDLFHV
jgi:hypothetical protein